MGFGVFFLSPWNGRPLLMLWLIVLILLLFFMVPPRDDGSHMSTDHFPFLPLSSLLFCTFIFSLLFISLVFMPSHFLRPVIFTAVFFFLRVCMFVCVYWYRVVPFHCLPTYGWSMWEWQKREERERQGAIVLECPHPLFSSHGLTLFLTGTPLSVLFTSPYLPSFGK